MLSPTHPIAKKVFLRTQNQKTNGGASRRHSSSGFYVDFRELIRPNSRLKAVAKIKLLAKA